ncbi:hypothetical protein ACTHRH_02170 [Paenibacillus sp. SAFN-117]
MNFHENQPNLYSNWIAGFNSTAIDSDQNDILLQIFAAPAATRYQLS